MATCTQRQIKKYDRLTTIQAPTPCRDISRTVVDISDRQQTEEEISVLAKDDNFAIALKTLAMEHIIAKIASGIRELESDVAEQRLQHRQADKGNATAILNTADYEQNIHSLLDPSS